MRERRRPTISERRAMQGTLDGVTLTARFALDAPDGSTIPPGTDVTKVASGWRNLATYLNRGYIVANPPVDPYRLPVLPDPLAGAQHSDDEVTPVERPKAVKVDAEKPQAQAQPQQAQSKDDAIAEAIRKLTADGKRGQGRGGR